MRLPRFLQEDPSEATSRQLYAKVVTQARHPAFYLELGVPDTPDGRFDMVSVHMMLLLRRMRRDGEAAAEPAQALFDYMFADMDQNLREMGIGDMGIGKRVKGMAQAFYGRIAAYDAGLASDDASLDAAVRRNVYRAASATDEQVAAVAGYMRQCAADLDGVPLAALLAGEFEYAPVPSLETPSRP